ncbi:MAG: alpha-L-rhamnosidase C-terminal domain-containing protein [Armatimonadota bacterium]|nr:alpha-L-rhamnosidase C-terminal domain-containing protein [Armatimonadota bacterium]
MRVVIEDYPFAEQTEDRPWDERGVWRARWIGINEPPPPPYVLAFRNRFAVPQDVTVRVHVSADERYELYLDGKRIGRGPERGDRHHWFFETYDLSLAAGEHVLTARVWVLGELAPIAQMTQPPQGFVLCPQEPEWDSLLATGVAPWEVKRLDGFQLFSSLGGWFTGAMLKVDGNRVPWGFENGEGEGWQPAQGLTHANSMHRGDRLPEHVLQPAILLPMIERPWQGAKVRFVANLEAESTANIPVRLAEHLDEEAEGWQALLDGASPLTVPAHTARRVIVDMGNYVCAYPEVVLSGGKGASVRIHWQEALYEDPRHSVKGNRDEVEGKTFCMVWHLQDGFGDAFVTDGGNRRRFDAHWWRAGRYVEIVVRTGDEPLTIDSLTFLETRYPLEQESTFTAEDPRIEPVARIAVRALQMCAHETYMDCPFFEQLMYVGDTRLQVLVTYAITRDDRLPRKALLMFDSSRINIGVTQSRYPSRWEQIIPPFSLWWVAMVHDYAMWRDDLRFVRERMPGVRSVMEAHLAHRTSEGLFRVIDGWNYADWVRSWRNGIPPATEGISGLHNWHLVYTLNLWAELERTAGEPELAQRAERLRDELAQAATERFWDERRGLFADDLTQEHFSEHTQCLAILSGCVDAERQGRIARVLTQPNDLAQTTIYFSHYLFETLRLLERTDLILKRLDDWYALTRKGLKTTIESPEPTRSDCHAWGAHPVFHFFATLLGIRPAAPGFREVVIQPQLGGLNEAQGTLVHPRGEISVRCYREGDRMQVEMLLPAGVKGTLVSGESRQPLPDGYSRKEISIGR